MSKQCRMRKILNNLKELEDEDLNYIEKTIDACYIVQILKKTELNDIDIKNNVNKKGV